MVPRLSRPALPRRPAPRETATGARRLRRVAPIGNPGIGDADRRIGATIAAPGESATSGRMARGRIWGNAMTMDVSVHGAIAGVVMVLATIAGLELAVINVEAPYLVFLPGVIAAFFVGGALTSAVAIGVAAVVTWYFLTPPVWSFALPSWQH